MPDRAAPRCATAASAAISAAESFVVTNADLCIIEATQAFCGLVGEARPGMALAELLPVFAGIEAGLWAAILSREAPEWRLHAVAHRPAPASPAPAGDESDRRQRYLTLTVQAHPHQPDRLLVTAEDVTLAAEQEQRMVQQRNRRMAGFADQTLEAAETAEA